MKNNQSNRDEAKQLTKLFIEIVFIIIVVAIATYIVHNAMK